MSTSHLIRWSGVAAIAAAGLLPLGDALSLLLFPAGMKPSDKAATATSLIVQVPTVAVALLLLLGALVGLYSRQADRAGALGFISFLLAFVGTALFFGTGWAFMILAPGLAAAAPDVLDAGIRAPSAWLGIAGFLIPIGLTFLGWLLFGLASLRAGVFPRWAAALLMVGMLLLLVADAIHLPVIPNVVFGVGLARMGYAVWSETRISTSVGAIAAIQPAAS
jgi:hypothetical protein